MHAYAIKLAIGFIPLLLSVLFFTHAIIAAVPGINKQVEVGLYGRQTLNAGYESSKSLEAGLESRQAEIITPFLVGTFGISVIAAAAAGVIYGFVTLFQDIIKFAEQHKIEAAFTQYYCQTLLNAGPWGMNAIIYHNQDSTFNFNAHVHSHEELDIGFGTQGYEGQALDYGDFTLAGDGGYENWAICGWFNRDPGSAYVSFYTPAGAVANRKRAFDPTDPPRFEGSLDDTDEEFAAMVRERLQGIFHAGEPKV